MAGLQVEWYCTVLYMYIVRSPVAMVYWRSGTVLYCTCMLICPPVAGLLVEWYCIVLYMFIVRSPCGWPTSGVVLYMYIVRSSCGWPTSGVVLYCTVHVYC